MPHSLAVLFALLAPAALPTRVDDIPVLERPRDHFYGAISAAKSVRVWWQVTPVSVPFGESFTLTLVVSNAVNPDELTRPPLLDFAAFRDLFSSIEDLPPDPTASGEATFSYRVTPRHEGMQDIPELKYRSYQPLAPPGYTTLTTHATKVPFTVTKPPVPPTQPLIGPAEFFAVRSDGAFTRSGGPDWWLWAGLFATGVVVGVVWVVGWRRLYPDAARLAVIRRNRAVRIALDRLRRPKVTADAVAVTLRNYLIARYGLPFTAQTPTEVAAGLEDVGVPAERAAEAEGVLRACDAARFAAATDTPVSAAAVAAMIERWEGVTAK
jgi:hypothetical protein